ALGGWRDRCVSYIALHLPHGVPDIFRRAAPTCRSQASASGHRGAGGAGRIRIMLGLPGTAADAGQCAAIYEFSTQRITCRERAAISHGIATLVSSRDRGGCAWGHLSFVSIVSARPWLCAKRHEHAGGAGATSLLVYRLGI